MVNIIKEEISLEESLKKKIEFICDFNNTKPTNRNKNFFKNITPFLLTSTLIQIISNYYLFLLHFVTYLYESLHILSIFFSAFHPNFLNA